MKVVARLRVCVLGLCFATVVGCGGGGDDSSANQTSAPPADGNSAPTIQGQPGSTVLAAQAYSFRPAASDADGDALTFSVNNLPNWATFDVTTGRVAGTPTAAQIGSYSNIRITVSDGRATASLAFSITVTEVGTGVATLSWTPPTQNSDGTALTNLAGYEIRYGRSADELSLSASITNPSINTYLVESLPSGVWFFAVSAVNTRGVSSPLSSLASKTIS